MLNNDEEREAIERRAVELMARLHSPDGYNLRHGPCAPRRDGKATAKGRVKRGGLDFEIIWWAASICGITYRQLD